DCSRASVIRLRAARAVPSARTRTARTGGRTVADMVAGAVAGAMPATADAPAGDTGIRLAPVDYTVFDTAPGRSPIAWRKQADGTAGIAATALPDLRHGRGAVYVRRRFPGATLLTGDTPPSAVRSAITAITSLLAGVPTDLTSVPLDMADIPEF